MKNCKIIAVASLKGGVAKSTTVMNLSYALAREGKKVLAVDLDPQANSSLAFGIENPDELQTPISQALASMLDGTALLPGGEFIIKGEYFDLIPCNKNLTVTEINLRDEMGDERTLAELLEPLRADYDYIIIDTAPSVGYLTINALAACDSVIIPVSPEYWSATGLTALMLTINKIKRRINPRVEVAGVLLTICETNTILFREVRSMLEEYCSDKIRIFDALIPRTTKVGRANLLCMPIAEYDPGSQAAHAYFNLAKEVDSYAGNSSKKATA